MHLILSFSAATFCFQGQSSLSRIKATDSNLAPLLPLLHTRSPLLNPSAYSSRSKLPKEPFKRFHNLILIHWDNGKEGNKEDVQITYDTGAVFFNQGAEGRPLGRGDICTEV